MSAVIKLCAAVVRQQAGRDDAEAEAWRLSALGAREEIDKLRAERRQLRARLVECRPWVGVCPFPNTPGFSEMIAIRDLADDTLEEVKP